jgi:hypothetical protein
VRSAADTVLESLKSENMKDFDKKKQGSFKRAKKGYEEIYVPAPKSKPVTAGEFVPTSDLPEWARQGFPDIKILNRVQSKLYLVTFGTDEPILLCAPTGAGKARFVTHSRSLDTDPSHRRT